ncbi:hypothetical protein, partial [Rothia nasimurium]|uniref:hypothetical protein n=1 Tax=Rothia nasimurium TaxID=85336 RepID=UPI001C5AC452
MSKTCKKNHLVLSQKPRSPTTARVNSHTNNTYQHRKTCPMSHNLGAIESDVEFNFTHAKSLKTAF